MAISISKRELEKKKQGKKLEKQQRKEERKAYRGGSSLDDMLAYVEEHGMITATPPDMSSKPKVDAETIAVFVPKKEEQEPVALRGRVEHFNTDKGYGFIKDLDSTEKYFFHISNAPADIAEGALVTFETERGQRGLNAVNKAFAKLTSIISHNQKTDEHLRFKTELPHDRREFAGTFRTIRRGIFG